METNEQKEKPIFTISSDQDMGIVMLSLSMYKGLMEKKDAPINRLDGKYQEALLLLMDRILPQLAWNCIPRV